MRILCLSFPASPDSDFVEKLTCLSPLVYSRNPGLIFIEVGSTSHLFGGEQYVLQKCQRLAQHWTKDFSIAIADRPYKAQALAQQQPSKTAVHYLEPHAFGSLSLDSLVDLEGLTPWESRRQVELMIQTFKSLGLDKIQDILAMKSNQFRARWGGLGITLWKRLHSQEIQPIHPLPLKNPFYSYLYFENSIDNRKWLMKALEESLLDLFQTAERLKRFGQKLQVKLHCEFSDVRHELWVEPVGPSRDVKLFADLLEKRIEKIDTQNPIREVEIQFFDVPEKVYQMDFFEPTDPTGDQWRRLISFCRQMGIEMGFLEAQPSHFPEESFRLSANWPTLYQPQDKVENDRGAIQVKTVYAKALSKSPRPPLLLKKPKPLSTADLKRMRFVSGVPSERIENEWWVDWKDRWLEKTAKKAAISAPNVSSSTPVFNSAQSASPALPAVAAPAASARDYYFAISPKGQWLWVFQEHKSKRFFLHGYFD